MVESERNERYDMGNERPTERRMLDAWTAWIGRTPLRALRRERAVAPLTMNRDGHLVRQSWLAADERSDRDCAPCCV